MDALLLIGRLVLAAVFLVAGIGKLADIPGSRRAVASFGVPTSLADPIGLLLPLAELAVAAALLPIALAPWAALGALVLLLAFIAGISLNLARGHTPDCHCFGQIYSEPVGAATLIRNGALALLALFLLVAGRTTAGVDPFAWMIHFTAVERLGVALGALTVVLLATQSWLLLRLTRQNGQLLRALAGSAARDGVPVADAAPDEEPAPSGLPVGSPAPRFTLPNLHGSMVTLDDLRAEGKPVMLVFTSPTCGPCAALIPEIGRWQREHPARLTIAVIGEGTVELNRSKVTEAGLQDVLLQRTREIAAAYDVPGTPGAVIVYPEGVIASPVALGADSIRGLLGQVLEVAASAPIALQDEVSLEVPPIPASAPGRHTASVGDPLPDLPVTELMGGTVRLPDLIESETLLLFWSSSCGFCAQMQPAIRDWELNPPPGAPRLIVILSPAAGDKQVVNFRAPIVIDRDGAVARALGANGTPMGVLVDADGRLASPVAAGEPEVMELARGRIPDAARSA
jgi:thiol-disulfide isomerase/thioredoxin/uncharacterized membrane protein YphA (DoxX/SURF4 family)